MATEQHLCIDDRGRPLLTTFGERIPDSTNTDVFPSSLRNMLLPRAKRTNVFKLGMRDDIYIRARRFADHSPGRAHRLDGSESRTASHSARPALCPALLAWKPAQPRHDSLHVGARHLRAPSFETLCKRSARSAPTLLRRARPEPDM